MTVSKVALVDRGLDSRAELIIEGIDTVIVDLPTIRPHGFAALSVDRLSYVLVYLRTRGGIIGIGEGATPAGPWWGGESVEAMKAMIDAHLGPALLGLNAAKVEMIRSRLASCMPRNHFAKAPLEMAAFDAWGKAVGLSVCELLGGAHRDRLPVTWALSSGDIDGVLEETRRRMADGHTSFKLKMGAAAPRDDLHRVESIMALLDGSAELSVDPNGSWDETDARWFCRELAALGVESIEQPVAGWNHEALQRLSRVSDIPLMADESLLSPRDAVMLGHTAAAAIFAIKVPKAGGLLNAVTMARIGEVTGRRCFGGSTLETRIGAAAAVAVHCSRPSITQCELVGPLLLADDIVAAGPRYEHGFVHLPTGPGLGVVLDDDKVAAHVRR